MLLDSLSNTLNPGSEVESVSIRSSKSIQIKPSENAKEGEHIFNVLAKTPGDKAMIAISRPIGPIAMFWKGGARPGNPAMPTDRDGNATTSLVNSAPLGCLMDESDQNILSYAYSSADDEIDIKYGVDEEHALFVVILEIVRVPAQSQLLVINRKEQATDALRELADWIGDGNQSFPIADEAREPVFSTWYAYLQNVDDESLNQQLAGIQQLGCHSLFIDDGWQEFGNGRGYAGCGDWIPDRGKFPNMRESVERFRQSGLTTVLWIAPLLLGERSQAFARLAQYAPAYTGDFGTYFHTLDPRKKVVRDYVAGVCRRLVNDYGIGGLKIDFLDQALAYRGQPLGHPEEGDIVDVGEAMQQMLETIRNTLLGVCKKTPIVEFRQPYSSPAIAPYSNIIRAADCPADAITNRIRTIDERLISGHRVVHGDMLLWDTRSNAEVCAKQILDSFFAVPQISVRPTDMSPEQFTTCRFLLQLWRRHRQTLLYGHLEPLSISGGYPLVNAYSGDSQISAVYQRNMMIDVNCETTHTLLILNATYEKSVTISIHSGSIPVVSGTSKDCMGTIQNTWGDRELNIAVSKPNDNTPAPGANGKAPESDDSNTYFLRLPAAPYGALELVLH